MQSSINQFNSINGPSQTIRINDNYLGDRVIFIKTNYRPKSQRYKKTSFTHFNEHNTQYPDINKAKEIPSFVPVIDPNINGIQHNRDLCPNYSENDPMFQ